MDFHNEVESLTRELVAVPSINNTEGEAVLAEKVKEYFQKLPYFKENPDNLIEQSLKNDHLNRKNIFALVKGKNGAAGGKTVIIHGHVDTVGIEDYGDLGEFAFNPDSLEKEMKAAPLPEEARKDLESGEWLFGRGSGDMKSGLAVHMAVIKYYSEQPEKLNGNLLFIATPVEENQHTGIMEALSVIEELKEAEGFSYQAALNGDYFSPMYPGDKSKYIYLGTVGKLLPSFYILGKETHAGQSFEGLDPNMLAAELIKEVAMNTRFSDGYKNEYTLPPVSLKLTDLKPAYDVQTPLATFLYFNVFTYTITPEQVVDLLLEFSQKAFKEVISNLNGEYEKYCRMTGMDYRRLPWEPKVYLYDDLHTQAREKFGEELDRELEELVRLESEINTDPRIICRKLVEKVVEKIKLKGPALVLFFGPPYNPGNTLKEEISDEKTLIDKLNTLFEEIGREENEEYAIRHFFPYTSDSSFLKIQDPPEAMEKLIANFPQWHNIFPAPVEKGRELNIPALNIGAWGKDAHQWTERVHKKFAFSTLPKLTIRVIEMLLQ